jgi:transposase-like protein
MPPWFTLITVLSKITRKNSNPIICCPYCGNRHTFIKWGFYHRYLFDDSLITIQRYRCDNDLCPRKTFSVLPHPFLRIVRASLCMLMYILSLHEHGHCIVGIARQTGNTWTRIQRWIHKAVSIRDWISQEYFDAAPCLSSDSKWTGFIRDFSWAFYPARYG